MVQTDRSLMQSVSNEIARYMHNQMVSDTSAANEMLAQHIKVWFSVQQNVVYRCLSAVLMLICVYFMLK